MPAELNPQFTCQTGLGLRNNLKAQNLTSAISDRPPDRANFVLVFAFFIGFVFRDHFRPDGYCAGFAFGVLKLFAQANDAVVDLLFKDADDGQGVMLSFKGATNDG